MREGLLREEHVAAGGGLPSCGGVAFRPRLTALGHIKPHDAGKGRKVCRAPSAKAVWASCAKQLAQAL